jgi:demethylmenaquinone methyltransferase/2-methoxy-6-polyprenyl-1,4-benzoquinol methylase
MKVLESAPERYERGMRLLTMGRLERVRSDITERLGPGDRVLDLGCGTGALAVQLAQRGCQVTGVDISPPMLNQATQRVRQAGLVEQVLLRELGAVDLDTAFGDCSFDAVVSTLVFSELSDDEIAYTLAECWRILQPGGQLLIADEVLPGSALGRIGTFLLRLPFAVVAFLLTQNTTHRVAGLGKRIEEAGFRIVDTGHYLARTLQLFVAEKAEQECLTG